MSKAFKRGLDAAFGPKPKKRAPAGSENEHDDLADDEFNLFEEESDHDVDPPMQLLQQPPPQHQPPVLPLDNASELGSGSSSEDSSSSSSEGSSSSSDSAGWGDSLSEGSSDSTETSEDEIHALQDVPPPENHNHPLYQGAQITVMQSFLLQMQHFSRFPSSREEKSSIIDLLRLHCPAGNSCFTSLYQLERYLGDPSSYSIPFDFCGSCHHLFTDGEEHCPNCHIPRYEDSAKRVLKNFFLMFDIKQELATRYRDPKFLELILHRFNREKFQADAIEDIYDGELYAQYPELQDPRSLSFLGSSDGIKVFKSSTQNLWPIMLVINELPPSIRFKEENMILVGAWFGSRKPDFNLFFTPLAEQLNALRNDGILLTNPNGGQDLVRAFLLTFNADNQAKDILLNKKANACGNCDQAPELAENVNGIPTVSVFAYQEEPASQRTRATFEADAEQADADNEDVNGIKGFSGLLLFDDLDLWLPGEYQHTGCLRVMRKMLDLMFNSAHAGKWYNYSHRVNDFDRLMRSVKAPAFITRPPRAFTTQFSYWKASEFRSFLLFWGPIVLKDILEADQYNHFLLFSSAMAILTSRSISPEHLKLADSLLNLFVDLFETIYELRWCSITVHALLHLPRSVKKAGPLWAYSTFPFESFYHHLREMIHGTRYVLEQLRHSIYAHRLLKTLARDHLNHDQLSYIQKLGLSLESGDYETTRRPNAKMVVEIAPGVLTVGRSNARLLPAALRPLVLQAANLGPTPLIRNFTRIFQNDEIIMGTLYTRSKKRSNSIVCYRDQQGSLQFFQVRSFHHVTQDNHRILIALGKKFLIEQGPFAPETAFIWEEDLVVTNSAFVEVQPLVEEIPFSALNCQRIIGVALYVHNTLTQQAFASVRWNRLNGWI